jgi:hypothetical protein
VGIGTTAVTGILTNTSASNKVFKINSIFVANVDGTNAADISISIIRNGTDFYLARTIAVPADATQIISTKDTYFYLEENVGIRAQASAADDLHVTIGYEEIE